MNIHYNTTTGQIVSYGTGSVHDDGFETSPYPDCKVLIVDNQPIDPRTQRVDPTTFAIVAKAAPDPDPDRRPEVVAAVRRELGDTDYLLLPHAPVDEADRPKWIAYRAALRDASKGNDTAAAMLSVIPARPDGIDNFAYLRGAP